MNINYTQQAVEACLDLIDTDIMAVWLDINAMPEDTDREKWKKKFAKIAEEYTLSSRFALMRIFQRQQVPEEKLRENPAQGFQILQKDGSVRIFSDITMQHAASLTHDELVIYQDLMMERASRQSDANAERDRALIRKALQLEQGRTTLLTREEAFQLGHMLQFTLDEMEWFLLRVFLTDAGFRYHSSNDLIEAYGFLTGASAMAVSALKGEYESRFSAVPKSDCEEKQPNWTRNTGLSLPDMVSVWPVEERDEKFLSWLGGQAPSLDLPSRSALRVYRNLAVFAYHLAISEETAPNVDVIRKNYGVMRTDFVSCIEQIVKDPGYADQTIEVLFQNGSISESKCKKVAGELLVGNLNLTLSDQTDRSKAWHVIDVLTNGSMTVNGGVNASRTRVKDILSGKVPFIEKSDMLYLLWFTSNLCWFDGKENPGVEEIYNRFFDFTELAEICLDVSGLPPFYPPHPLEQSMMLSIVYGYRVPEASDPAETYEKICSSLIARRARRAE